MVVNFASGRGVRLAIVFAQARKKASFSTSAYTCCQGKFAIQRFFSLELVITVYHILLICATTQFLSHRR